MLQLRNTEFVEIDFNREDERTNFIDAKNTLLLYKYLLSTKF